MIKINIKILIISLSIFLVIQNFGCSTRKTEVSRAILETKITSPVKVVNQYYKFFIQKNFGACYNLLDKRTQSQNPKKRFIKRARISCSQWVIILNINHIRLDDQKCNIALVRFDLKTRITILEAKLLNKSGISYAKPGIYIFHSIYPLIFEDGQWKIMRYKR